MPKICTRCLQVFVQKPGRGRPRDMCYDCAPPKLSRKTREHIKCRYCGDDYIRNANGRNGRPPKDACNKPECKRQYDKDYYANSPKRRRDIKAAYNRWRKTENGKKSVYESNKRARERIYIDPEKHEALKEYNRIKKRESRERLARN